jgi:hypothetical protein
VKVVEGNADIGVSRIPDLNISPRKNCTSRVRFWNVGTLIAVREALGDAGIRFIDSETEGVAR